jgi:hypothetical protein
MAEIERDESVTLIASNKVEGTAVYGPDEEKLGSIYNFMVDKETGQVEYAVLQFGGVLGVGSDFYPLPWEMLEYDDTLGGYVVELNKEALNTAPHFSANEEPIFNPAYGGEIYGAYGLHYPGVP